MASEEIYQKVKELFLIVAKLPKEEQRNYLKQACGEDFALMGEVEALLLAENKQLFSKQLERLVDLQIIVEKHQLSRGLLINERYQIELEIGRGGFSVVYLANDLQLHSRPVVVKEMLGTINSTNQNWQETKFFAEIKALTRINHPNVVAIYDYGLINNNKPFFVMELIPGENLRQILTKARTGLSSDQALRIIKQIANALSTVHQLGIYHRDLKPENIMVRQLAEEEHVKVIDFGIATVKESATSPTFTNSVAGTLTYMAPEQFESKPSASSDIYALGVVAYEMLTGRTPFNINGNTSLKEAVSQLKRMQKQSLITKPSSFNPNFSLEVDEVFVKVLSYEAKDRYFQPQEFVKALDKALATKGKQNIYWEKLCSLAQPTTHSWFINEEVRKKVKNKGSCDLYENLTNTYSLNTKLSMVLNLPSVGYLLLIVKDGEKDPICLCPSRYIANDELSGYPVLLPTEGLIYNSLPLSDTKGRKQAITIVSKTSLELNWPKATLASPAQNLTSTDINALINKLEHTHAYSWSAFYSYVDII